MTTPAFGASRAVLYKISIRRFEIKCRFDLRFITAHPDCTMPKLLDEVILLVDCPSVGTPFGTSQPMVVSRGSRGVLVDHSKSRPTIWTIEFSISESPDIVLVEAEESRFRIVQYV